MLANTAACNLEQSLLVSLRSRQSLCLFLHLGKEPAVLGSAILLARFSRWVCRLLLAESQLFLKLPVFIKVYELIFTHAHEDLNGLLHVVNDVQGVDPAQVKSLEVHLVVCYRSNLALLLWRIKTYLVG